MEKIRNLLLIGCGHMGGALLKSWLDSDLHSVKNICVVDPLINESYRFKSTHSINLSYHVSKADLPDHFEPDCVFFAIKPQMVDKVVPEYRYDVLSPLYMSILAGTRVRTFCKYLGEDAHFVRLMPNLPVMYQEAASVAYANANVNKAEIDFVNALLSQAGILKWIDQEEHFDAVTALSGSGPAYVFAMAEAMIKAGMEAGLDEALSRDLSLQTIFGAATMLKQSSETAKTLRENVTSPGGTTEAGLKELIGEGRLDDLMHKTILAAKKRSIELS